MSSTFIPISSLGQLNMNQGTCSPGTPKLSVGTPSVSSTSPAVSSAGPVSGNALPVVVLSQEEKHQAVKPVSLNSSVRSSKTRNVTASARQEIRELRQALDRSNETNQAYSKVMQSVVGSIKASHMDPIDFTRGPALPSDLCGAEQFVVKDHLPVRYDLMLLAVLLCLLGVVEKVVWSATVSWYVMAGLVLLSCVLAFSVLIRRGTCRVKTWRFVCIVADNFETEGVRGGERDIDSRPLNFLGYQRRRDKPHMCRWNLTMQYTDLSFPFYHSMSYDVVISMGMANDVISVHGARAVNSDNMSTVRSWVETPASKTNWESAVYPMLIDETTMWVVDYLAHVRDTHGWSLWTGYSNFFGGGLFGSQGWS